jgi:glutamate--cysteine ligase
MSIDKPMKQIEKQPVELPTDRPIERPARQNGDRIIEQLISQIPLDCYPGAMIGVEKESLRIRRDGYISHAPHPHILGSSLTHPCITTDFSEALLELVTPPCTSSRDALAFLADTETFVHQQLPDEYLWPASMPCLLRGEEDIPIAQYGVSKLGKMKTIYRRGLAHRYGKTMQAIAGTHFNFSFPENLLKALQLTEKQPVSLTEYSNQKYMALIRNLQRYGWLNLYLFGASPAICQSFVEDKPDNLGHFDQNTYYHPFATSLRMSEIGYTNNSNHSDIEVSYDSLEDYIQTLGDIVNTPYPSYESINNKSSHEPQQLNSNLLQIENEYYTTVRPKQIPQENESLFKSLEQRGIRYVELRSLDINPFSPTGLEDEQLHFLELFMHYCLLKDSPNIDTHEASVIRNNHNLVALEGRDPQLQLNRDGSDIRMQHWAMEMLDEMQSIATALDKAHDTLRYSRSLTRYNAMVIDSQLTPSARILSEMQQHKESFTEFSMRKAMQHSDHYQAKKLSERRFKYYESLSRKSHRQQQQIETSDNNKALMDRLVSNSVTV